MVPDPNNPHAYQIHVYRQRIAITQSTLNALPKGVSNEGIAWLRMLLNTELEKNQRLLKATIQTEKMDRKKLTC